MSRHIVKVFNQVVAEDDILYHLGDWSFGGSQNIWNFRKQLRCRHIRLCFGNHDAHIKDDKVLPNVFQSESDMNFYDGEPETESFKLEVRAQELFQECSDVMTVKHGEHTFFLSHYAHRVFYGSHKGVIHLYGHSHDSLDKTGNYWGKSMDCGIDSAKRILGEYRPFSIEEVISIMDKREVKFIDHHNSKTDI